MSTKEPTVAREGSVSSLQRSNAVRSRSRSSMSDSEFRGITRILEKRNPNSSDAPRYLEREAMSDRELRNFYNVATRSTYNYDLNQMTRENSRKWANLAMDEMSYRRKNK